MRIDVPVSHRGSQHVRRRRPVWLAILPLLGMFLAGLALPLFGADTLDSFMKARGWRDGEPRGAALQAWAASFTEAAPELPELRFDIRFKNYKKLLDKRVVALRTGRLDSSNVDFIPGQLTHAGNVVRVKLRLQGDEVRWLRGEKWPIRVRVREGGHVLGVERFTLRSPVQDGFYDKMLAFDQLRGRHVIVPSYRLVTVTVNGKRLGSFAMEEYLSNELIERNGRVPGPILRVDDASVLPKGVTPTVPMPLIARIADLRGAQAAVVRAGRWQKTPKRRRVAKRARTLLNDFLRGDRTAHATFDSKSVGIFAALVERIGADELLRWDNLRWHYNVLVDRLEPIAYASDPIGISKSVGIARQSPLVAKMLQDPRIGRWFRAPVKVPKSKSSVHSLRGDYPMALRSSRPFRKRRKLVEVAVETLLPVPVGLPLPATNSLARAQSTGAPLVLGPGTVRIATETRLDRCPTVTVAAGTVIEIGAAGALYISHATVLFNGTRERPIEIRVAAARTAPTSGQANAVEPVFLHGIVLSQVRAELRHVRILGVPTKNPIGPPPLVIHNSHAVVEHIQVLHPGGRAAIGWSRSSGVLRAAEIRDCSGDGLAIQHAFDLRVDGLVVEQCKGDAVDIRGGRDIALIGVRVTSFGDKAVSIGEAANVTIEDLQVTNGPVALAVKDGSRVVASKITVRGVTGSVIAAFAKKSRYGPPSATATDVTATDGTKMRYVSHGGGTLTVNGKPIASAAGSLDQLYTLGWLGQR